MLSVSVSSLITLKLCLLTLAVPLLFKLTYDRVLFMDFLLVGESSRLFRRLKFDMIPYPVIVAKLRNLGYDWFFIKDKGNCDFCNY